MEREEASANHASNEGLRLQPNSGTNGKDRQTPRTDVSGKTCSQPTSTWKHAQRLGGRQAGQAGGGQGQEPQAMAGGNHSAREAGETADVWPLPRGSAWAWRPWGQEGGTRSTPSSLFRKIGSGQGAHASRVPSSSCPARHGVAGSTMLRLGLQPSGRSAGLRGLALPRGPEVSAAHCTGRCAGRSHCLPSSLSSSVFMPQSCFGSPFAGTAC